VNDPVYPAYDSFVPQVLGENDEWIAYSPTDLRSKAEERLRLSRAENPDRRFRLLIMTTSYRVEDEDPS
jgi:hypothetical protein